MGMNDIDNGPSSADSFNSEFNLDPISVQAWAVKIIEKDYADLFKSDPIVSTSIQKNSREEYYLLTVKSRKSKYTFLIEPGEHITLIEDPSSFR